MNPYLHFLCGYADLSPASFVAIVFSTKILHEDIALDSLAAFRLIPISITYLLYNVDFTNNFREKKMIQYLTKGPFKHLDGFSPTGYNRMSTFS